jgi:hypothetical protein
MTCSERTKPTVWQCAQGVWAGMAVWQVGVDYGPRHVINWGDPLEVREMALLDMLSATIRRRRTNVSTATV